MVSCFIIFVSGKDFVILQPLEIFFKLKDITNGL